MAMGSRPKVQDVSIQDATNPVILAHAVREIAETTLLNDTPISSSSITLASGHGFVNGTAGQVLVVEGCYMGTVLNVAGDVVTVDIPTGYAFTAGTKVLRCSKGMNVDGSTTPVVFGLKASAGRKFDITGFSISAVTTTAMDDYKFTGLATLTKPIYVRVKKSTTWYNNVLTARCNGELKLYGDVAYSSKAPSGFYGINFDFSFLNTYSVVERIDGDLGQEIQIVIPSDLSDITEMCCIFHGHVVDDSLTDGITKIDIDGSTWTPLTLVGQSATVWTKSNTPFLIASSEDGNPSVETALPMGRYENCGVLSLEPDLPSIRFYAKCINPGETSSVVVDIIG